MVPRLRSKKTVVGDRFRIERRWGMTPLGARRCKRIARRAQRRAGKQECLP